MMYTPNST